ncbi:MAG: glycosyltransferase family 39 protein [Ardenticatenia bacterium]|nr:glycosyltransferase family 39 protein [Ardenticatenia bacterium]
MRALLLFYLVLALGYNLVVPLGEAPDEVSHYGYVRWVATRATLPPPEGAASGEVFQPPLYYTMVAPLTAWQPDEDIPVVANGDFELDHPARRIRVLIQLPAARWPWRGEALAWHIVRLASALFGLVSVMVTYQLARTVVPRRPWAAVLAAATVAFLPQFTFQGGTVTNDTLTVTLASTALLAAAAAVRHTWRRQVGLRGWCLAGLLGGLSIWAKTSNWLLAATTGLAWLMTWSVPGRWARLVALLVPWSALALPWFAMNWWRSGDPMGWNLLHQVTDERVAPLTWAVMREVSAGLVRTFWAGFGGAAHISLPLPLNALLGAGVLLALIGLVWWLRRAEREERLLVGWLIVHIALVLLAWVQWTRTVLGTGQGRLIFPALPAMALLFALGWVEVGRRMGRPTHQVALAGTGAWALLGGWTLLFFLRPLYTAPPVLPPPPELRTADWTFGVGLQLRRYAVPWNEDTKVPPGTRTEAYFEWIATQPLDDRRVRLQLVDRKGQPIWWKEGTPSAGRDTSDQWAVGVPVGAWHRLAVPPTAQPGWYRLMLSVHTPDGRTLPIRDAGGQVLGEQIMVGQVTVVGP